MPITPQEITLFLVAIALLLGTARVLGEIARRLHQPVVLGEILAGVILGPTILGRLAPEFSATLFPPMPEDPTAAIPAVAIALEALFVLAVTLFLLVAGMEVDLSLAFRQGKAAISVTAFGMTIPFVMGFALAWYLPGLLMEVPEGREFVFALFFATALCISALPVIAKILKDMNLIKTDLGAIVVASATVNDLIGWIIFAIVLGLMGAGKGSLGIEMVILLTLVFTVGMLTVARWGTHRFLPWLQAHTSWPAGVLSFALAAALLAAAFTEWLGIHAIFGAFLFGVCLGDSRHLRERTRATLDQFISFIFAPLFFASIGLKVDFLANFSLVPVVVVLVIATVGKIAGCVLGAMLAGMGRNEALAIGFAKNARGAMEIILGLLALQYGLIDDTLFVALVVMALVTSMLSGTLMQWVLKRTKPVSFLDYLSAKGFLDRLETEDRQGAISALATKAAEATGLDAQAVAREAWEREGTMPTGLPNGIAIPHARVEGLAKPVVALARTLDGVDFDAPDGSRAKLIFLILTPKGDSSAQLEILSGIARLAGSPDRVADLVNAKSFTEMLALLRSDAAEEGAH